MEETMGSNGIVKENAHNNIDQEKYKANYDSIDWSKLKNKKGEKKNECETTREQDSSKKNK